MYKAILNSLKSDPIVFVDDQHIVRYMNETAMKKFVKKEGDALIGKSIFECHNEKSAEMIKAYFQDMKEGKIEAVNVRKKGHIQGVMQVVKDDQGKVIGYLERHETITDGPVNLKENQYQKAAQYYDALIDDEDNQDIEFYKQIIGTHKDVLEVGCGTGRVGLALSKEENRVVGVDVSREMISRFNEKIIDAMETLTYPIKTYCEDFLNYNGSKKFDYIIFPFRVFQVFFSDQIRQRVLMKAKSQLKDEGRIILTLFNPNQDLLASWELIDKIDKDIYDDCLDIRILRKIIGKKHFEKQQIISYENHFEIYRGHEIIEFFVEPMRQAYQYHPQLMSLFHQNGFNVVAMFGDWNKNPIDEESSSELIYVLE